MTLCKRHIKRENQVNSTGRVHNPDVLERLIHEKRQLLLAVPRARTHLPIDSPLTRAFRTLNIVASDGKNRVAYTTDQIKIIMGLNISNVLRQAGDKAV
ncbi:unnamed protein product [Pieris macdunnoughi]|uniref:Uncharacterized protein n=1 Tax=Pieris macdunnoughi TaxID=345717 RepID=A0A821V3V8_9NEOP|nr:unnamed protein product [Pieris macdunnoughi]